MTNKRDRKAFDHNESALENFLFGHDLNNEEVDDESDDGSNVDIILDSAPITNSVWVDEDDENLEVDLDATNRLKKFKKNTDGQNKINGSVYTKLLQDRHALQNSFVDRETLVSAAKRNKDKTLSAEELLLSDSASLLQQPYSSSNNSSSNSNYVSTTRPPISSTATLDIARLVDANATDFSKDKITAVNFHHQGNILLTAGVDKLLKIFKIDGESNEKQLSVRFTDMAILSAQFLPFSNEIILGGRKPYFYTYDVESGHINKIPGVYGKNLKTHERIYCSSEGSKIAIQGVGGYTHILHGKSKSHMMDLKMNTPLRSFAFINDTMCISSGLDAEVYIWDIRHTNRCISRFKHEDGMCTSALDAVYPTHSTTTSSYTPCSYYAVGSESGVVSLYSHTLPSNTTTTTTTSSSNNSNNSNMTPTLLKSVMNLTTKITCTKFHPSGQLLAIASNEKVDQLRMVHVPTGKVYNNWPTERTPLRRVQCMDFSPGGAYLAVGNNVGKVLLYRLNHFDQS